MANKGFKGCKNDSHILSQERVVTLTGSKNRRRREVVQEDADTARGGVQGHEEKSRDRCLVGGWQCDCGLEEEVVSVRKVESFQEAMGGGLK